MILSMNHRIALTHAATYGIVEIEETIRALKEAVPEAFHTDDTLRTRRFVHEPKEDIECDAWLYSCGGL
jgi:hypothetical protein